jgi:hypothetical protein
MKQADHYAVLALALFGHDETLAEQFVAFATANTGDNGRLTTDGVDKAMEFLANSPVLRGEVRSDRLRVALANARFVA